MGPVECRTSLFAAGARILREIVSDAWKMARIRETGGDSDSETLHQQGADPEPEMALLPEEGLEEEEGGVRFPLDSPAESRPMDYRSRKVIRPLVRS